MKVIFTKQEYNKNKCLKQAAHTLRTQQTIYEKILWQKLKGKQLLNIQFHRQKVLLNKYIVDFYAPKIKLVVELDGFQHSFIENKENDFVRDQALNSSGIYVKRYSNTHIKNNINYVIKDLRDYILIHHRPLF